VTVRARRSTAPAVAVAAVLVVLGTVVGWWAGDGAGAQAAPTLELRSVTPWVDDSGTWVAELDTVGLPFDGVVRVSVRQRVRGTDAAIRDRLERQVAGEDLGSQVAATRPVRVLEVIDPSGRVRLELPLRSADGGERIRLTERGLYPVVVEIEAADGTALATRVLHLAYVGSDPPPPMGVTVLTPVQSGPVLATDGTLDIAEATAAARRQLRLADAAGELPLTVDLDPEVLIGLASSSAPEDQELLERLADHLRASRVLRRTWAPVDLEGWIRAGRTRVVRDSLVAGQDAVAERAGQLVDPRVWGPDPSLGPAGLGLLRAEGVTHVVTTEDRLAEATPPRGETGTSRPVRLGTGGSSVDALVLDERIQAALAGPDAVDDDPVARAHTALVATVAPWFADGQLRRGRVVQLGTDVPDEVAEAYLGLLRAPTTATGPVVEVREPDRLVEDLTPLTVRRSGRDQPWVRTLREVSSSSATAALRRTADRLGELRPRTTAAISMLPSDDPGAAQASVALQLVVHRRLGDTERERVLDLVAATDDRALDAVSTQGRRTITVTARDTTIPLRLSNAHDRPLRVRLRFESPRLRFVRGEEQELTLEPGNNRIDVPVTVRSSGEFLLRTTVESPAGRVVLARSSVRVRSTTFSGVGLILSGGALLVLVVWWGRTARRGGGTERTRPRPTDEPEDPDPVPVATSPGDDDTSR